ncbi:MAG TPA: hypothetical protein VL026_10180 [Rhizomicrobium sp.]|nr:hypothetical protein [Rhizomicrobium sp.]
MRKIVVVVLALLSLGCANAQAEDCKLKMVASYDMLPVDGAVVIPVQIAGKPRPMGVGLQSAIGSVSEGLADAMGLEPQHIARGTVYSSKAHMDELVAVPDINIGMVHLDRAHFALGNGASAANGSWIGNDILSVFDIELDFAARKVRFFSPDHCKGKVVYWSSSQVAFPFRLDNNKIQFAMNLDGHEISTTFTLGCSCSALNWRVARGVFGLSEDSPRIHTLHEPDGTTVQSASFESLSVGGLSIPKPSLFLIEDTLRSMARYDTPDKMQNQPGYELVHMPHLILGLDVLKHLRVYIAYQERMIYLTAADAH